MLHDLQSKTEAAFRLYCIMSALRFYIAMTQLAFDILFFGRLWGAGQEKVRILKVTKGPRNILVTEVSAISEHVSRKAFHEGNGQEEQINLMNPICKYTRLFTR